MSSSRETKSRMVSAIRTATIIKPKRRSSLGLSLDSKSAAPIYVQIENWIRVLIASGRLNDDDLLPSISDLARELGINPNTVLKAYGNLTKQGLLLGQRRKAIFVSSGAHARCVEECRQNIAQQLHALIQEATIVGMPKKKIMSLLRTSLSRPSQS